MPTSPHTVRVSPATTIVHVEVNAGEDLELEVSVFDDDDAVVLIDNAVATIGPDGGPALHTFSVAAGNLAVIGGSGKVRLSFTKDESNDWYREWGQARWQLDIVDIYDRTKRACEGSWRVRASRRS